MDTPETTPLLDTDGVDELEQLTGEMVANPRRTRI